MGNRATVEMKNGDKLSHQAYIHWGGWKIGRALVEAEATAQSTDPDECMQIFMVIAQAAGWKPERVELGVRASGEWDAGDFLVDTSQSKWTVVETTGNGYGLVLDGLKYHFGAPFEVPGDANGYSDAKQEDTHLHTAV